MRINHQLRPHCVIAKRADDDDVGSYLGTPLDIFIVPICWSVGVGLCVLKIKLLVVDGYLERKLALLVHRKHLLQCPLLTVAAGSPSGRLRAMMFSPSMIGSQP